MHVLVGIPDFEDSTRIQLCYKSIQIPYRKLFPSVNHYGRKIIINISHVERLISHKIIPLTSVFNIT